MGNCTGRRDKVGTASRYGRHIMSKYSQDISEKCNEMRSEAQEKYEDAKF